MSQVSRKSWVGVLFGMFFIACGLWAAHISAGKAIITYITSSDWVEVPASIHSVRLVRHRGESTTYSVNSDYSYRYNGSVYSSDRVSLSTGSDNIGSYWQDLERALLRKKRNNTASALVNPKDPAQSLLDRTFRWNTLIFGLVFVTIFGGIGSFIVWASLREPKPREARVQDEKDDGIASDQKTGSLVLAAFGGLFFVIGSVMSLLVLPDALRKGEYGALFVLLFVVLGVGIGYYAFTVNRAYRKFGPTPLFLDPAVPGVGGQLGGQFKISAAGVSSMVDGVPAELQARLTCTRRSKSGDSTSYSVKWQEEAPVYLKETATGVEASFLFEIPDTCSPSKEWSRRSSIEWSVTVEGKFGTGDPGKFERSWEVVVEDSASQASNVLNIPQAFLEKAKERSEERAKTSALDQIPVTEDTQYINVDSKAGRDLATMSMGILFGVFFAGVGLVAVKEWWPGYIFILIGTVVALASLYIMGKSIEVKIDKNTLVLYTRESWFGFVYAHREGVVQDRDQFKIKLTSSSSTQNKLTEYYAVDFHPVDDGKKIRVAYGIEGKKEALVLKAAIIDRCFGEESVAAAA